MVSLPRRLGLFLATFLITIPMQVNVLGSPVGVALSVMLPMSLWYVVEALLNARGLRDEMGFLLLVFGLLVYFLFVAVMGRVQDLAVVTMCSYGLIIFTATVVLARWYRRAFGEEFAAAGLKHLFLVGVLHSIIQIGVLIAEPFANALYSVVFLSENSIAHLSQGYRSSGLFSSGAAILSTFNAMMLTLGLTLFLKERPRPRLGRVVAMALACVIQILAIAVSGRTGFAALLLSLAVLAVHEIRAGEAAEATRRLCQVGLVMGVLVVASLAYVGFENVEQNVRWSFEFIYSWLETGTVSTESTSVLFGDMFFLPESIAGTIFGTSNFGRSPNFPYIDSDVGYILMIHGGGIVGLLAMMSVYAYLFVQTRTRPAGPLSILMTCFVAIIFLVNIKDFYFLQNDGVTQIILFCFALLIVQRQRDLSRLPQVRRKAAFSHA